MRSSYKILVIDDDEIFLELAKIQLEIEFEEAIEVHTAINKREIESMMNDTFDMILIDLNMPQISGWQVIERYQEKLKNPNCIALICSSSIDPRDHKRAKELEGTISQMISKPIELSLIREYLDKL